MAFLYMVLHQPQPVYCILLFSL